MHWTQVRWWLAGALLLGSCGDGGTPPSPAADESTAHDAAVGDSGVPKSGLDAGSDGSTPARDDGSSMEALRDGSTADASQDGSSDGARSGPSGGDAGAPRDAAPVFDAPDDAACSRAKLRADVIWALDTSGSTLFAQTQIQANHRALLELAMAEPELRVVLLGDQTLPDGGAPRADGGAAPSTPSNVFRISGPVDSKALLAVLLSSFPRYATHLRSGVPTIFVVVTDDDDQIASSTFKEDMEQQLGHSFVFHAVASPSVNGAGCIDEVQMKSNPLCSAPIPAICAASAPGTYYYELAVTTGGERISICKQDWSPLFERIRQAGGSGACP